MKKKPRVFQLSRSTVDVHRTIGRDEAGRPILEKVCMLAEHELFADVDGNVLTVPLQTGRVPSKESSEKYGRPHRLQLIRDGYLPQRECPHTLRYSDEIAGGGPLVKPPEDMVAGTCNGSPEGCVHFKAVVKARVAIAKDAARVRSLAMQQMTQEQAQHLASSMVQVASALQAGVGGARNALRSGKGEPAVPA
jgi:hypothetical protein